MLGGVSFVKAKIMSKEKQKRKLSECLVKATRPQNEPSWSDYMHLGAHASGRLTSPHRGLLPNQNLMQCRLYLAPKIFGRSSLYSSIAMCFRTFRGTRTQSRSCVWSSFSSVRLNHGTLSPSRWRLTVKALHRER